MTSQSDNGQPEQIGDKAWIVYDNECPFCKNYVHFFKLQKNIGPVSLIKARESGPEVQAVLKKGYDLDAGMVLYYQGRFYHGSEAVHMMALLGGKSDFFNKTNKIIFQNKKIAEILYPILKFFRRITLMFLGKKSINTTSFRQE